MGRERIDRDRTIRKRIETIERILGNMGADYELDTLLDADVLEDLRRERRKLSEELDGNLVVKR